MKQLWKLHLDNEPRQMHSLFPPLIVERVTTPEGVKQIAIDAGVSDNIYAIDVEKGEVLWKKHFVSTWTPPANGGRGGGILCPGGITATPGIASTGTAEKVHHLRSIVGRHAAPLERGRRRRCCVASKFMPSEWQAFTR